MWESPLSATYRRLRSLPLCQPAAASWRVCAIVFPVRPAGPQSAELLDTVVPRVGDVEITPGIERQPTLPQVASTPTLPNFHLRTQEELNRLGGWAQFAGIQRGDRTVMAFELYVSRYGPIPHEPGKKGSKRAFLDLKLALRGQGYRLDWHAARLLPRVPDGGATTAVQYLGPQGLVVMACWSGPREIEGIALYDHRSPVARWTAWTSLTLQIRLAWIDGS